MSARLVFILLPLVGSAGVVNAGEPSPHRVQIEIAGPLALVEVERPLPVPQGSGTGPRRELLLDVDLPEGAALVGWDLSEGGPRLRLTPVAESEARAAWAVSLRERGLAATDQPIDDEGPGLRLRVAGVAPGSAVRLRYRFVAPLACRQGRFVLAMPGARDVSPTPPELSVSFARLSGVVPREPMLAGTAIRVARMDRSRAFVRGPARAGWELSFTAEPGRKQPSWPARVLVAGGSVGPGREAVLAVGLCRPPLSAMAPLPDRVVFALDRSRSVGAAGILLERDAAHAVLRRLAPNVRFDAVLFDQSATRLFALPRMATDETLAALDGVLGPGDLRNGTDLPAALRRVVEAIGAEADAAARWLVVLLTDGALPELLSRTVVADAISALPPAGTDIAVLVVRPGHDDPPHDIDLAILGHLPTRLGGVLRTLEAADIGAGVAEALADVGQGGDLFEVATSLADGRRIALGGGLAPGAGRTELRSTTAALPGKVRLSGVFEGRERSTSAAVVRVAPPWLRALHAPAGIRSAWLGRSPGLSALAQWRPRPPVRPDGVLRGDMDRQVVRNALSLAYLPRARACYLSRGVKSAADLALRGRLRLELTLERGEMLDAVVRDSTLGRPDIEACLREAAFGLEVPRPLHRDAAVVAVLNLVFQPRTVTRTGDASALDRDIDLLIGPVSFPTDPQELLGR